MRACRRRSQALRVQRRSSRVCACVVCGERENNVAWVLNRTGANHQQQKTPMNVHRDDGMRGGVLQEM